MAEAAGGCLGESSSGLGGPGVSAGRGHPAEGMGSEPEFWSHRCPWAFLKFPESTVCGGKQTHGRQETPQDKTCRHSAWPGWRSEELDGGNGDQRQRRTRVERGPRQLPASSSAQVAFQGSTWLITVLLKTLVFISNPYGIASLADLLAGLAGVLVCLFVCWTYPISLLFTQLRDSLQSFGEIELC